MTMMMVTVFVMVVVVTVVVMPTAHRSAADSHRGARRGTPEATTAEGSKAPAKTTRATKSQNWLLNDAIAFVRSLAKHLKCNWILVESWRESLLHLHYELGVKKNPLSTASYYNHFKIDSHLLPTKIIPSKDQEVKLKNQEVKFHQSSP
jgi:hypothetical protein